MLRKLLRQWFNVQPTPDCEPFKDRYGRTYWLRWRGDKGAPDIQCFYRGRLVGIVHLLWNKEVLELCDIRLSRPEHRNRGIGTELLKRVLAYARTNKATAIKGFIVEKDAAENPHLFDWYEQHGFSVKHDRYEIRVALIRLDLRPSSTGLGASVL